MIPQQISPLGLFAYGQNAPRAAGEARQIQRQNHCRQGGQLFHRNPPPAHRMGQQKLRRVAALLPCQHSHGCQRSKKRPAQSKDIAAFRPIKSHNGSKAQFIQPERGRKASHPSKQRGHIIHGVRKGGIHSHAHCHQSSNHRRPDQKTGRPGAHLLAKHSHWETLPS